MKLATETRPPQTNRRGVASPSWLLTALAVALIAILGLGLAAVNVWRLIQLWS